MRILFIPLLGILIPFVSGIINYKNYPFPALVAAHVFFIFTSFIIWRSSNWMHLKIRPLFNSASNPFIKISAVSASASLFGAAIGGIAGLIWYKISRVPFSWNAFYKFLVVCMLAVIVFTLVYEILFLSKERELDTQLVSEMDRELTHAELSALHNEMDPHFIFNSLNAMGSLILSNPVQAHLFNSNLAQVFKYFLLNKNRDLIPLQEELEFLDNYFFLLQIRYENKLMLKVSPDVNAASILIPPCALQILLENSIKHNAFSDSRPLDVNISLNGRYLTVSNPVWPKPHSANSTHTGLKNLGSRFRLICKKDIVVEKGPEVFIVKLPVIKQTQNL